VLLVAPIDEAEQAWTLPRSFSNRTLAIDLEPIGAQRPEAAIWSEFEAMRPTLVTALAETVATALRRIRDIDLANVGRFPDGAAWAAAAAPALGLTESAAAGALTDPDAIWMGADPLRDAVHALVGRDSAWTGDPAALLQQLRAIAPLAVLPAAPRGLEQALAGIAGIELSFSKGERGESVLTVARAGDAPQRATVVRR
jgi:hypothetical protein